MKIIVNQKQENVVFVIMNLNMKNYILILKIVKILKENVQFVVIKTHMRNIIEQIKKLNI